MTKDWLDKIEFTYSHYRRPGATMTQAIADVLFLIDEVKRLRDINQEQDEQPEDMETVEYRYCGAYRYSKVGLLAPGVRWVDDRCRELVDTRSKGTICNTHNRVLYDTPV